MPVPAKKAAAPDVRHDLDKQIAAAGALKHQLVQMFAEDGGGQNRLIMPDDLTLLRDMIEGETGLYEAVDATLRQMKRDLTFIDALASEEKETAARRKRLADRVEAVRAMLLNVLDILEEKNLERPLARLTRKPTAAKVVVTDEAEIPSRFFETPEPVLSKAELAKALKDRRDTVEQKLAEIAERVKTGEMTEEAAAGARERVLAAFPAVPGADLEEGVTIQVKWS